MNTAILDRLEDLQGSKPPRAAVAAVIVSRDRPAELARTVDAVMSQRAAAAVSIIIVDSSADPPPAFRGRIKTIRSAVNLGGAGGFALGILQAVAAGAEWLWLMDDDGRPHDTDVLAVLLAEAEARDYDAVAPAVLDAADPSRFAFPYPVARRYVFAPRELPPDALIPNMAHLFNGLLIRAAAIFRTGLPDLRLFTRGDEIDFLYRMRNANLRFATTMAARFEHPSSNHELFPVFGRLHVVYPESRWKRRTQYRNRGYNFFRNRQFLILAVDLVRYPYFFLLVRHGDLAGLAEWAGCMWQGLIGNVHVEPAVDLRPLAALGSAMSTTLSARRR